MGTNYRRTRSARIVLAEDDRAIARLIEIALKRTGIPHDLEIVYDGQQAIAAVERDISKLSPFGYQMPDLLLLDLHMPGKNGFDVLEHLKRHVLLRRVPVVMFSNSDLESDVARAYDLHVNAFVRKSTEFADLCETMDRVLRFWLDTAITSF